MINLNCFKSYDIRGKVPNELSPLLAYNIAIAFSKIMNCKKVVVGYDVRLSSPEITEFFIKGLNYSGVQAINIGLCGTEEVYFHCFSNDDIDGGAMITASHNPKQYNGIKLVGRGAKPISMDNDLALIKDYVSNNWQENISESNITNIYEFKKTSYIKHLLSYYTNHSKPLKILINTGNSAAYLLLKELEQHLPHQFFYINEIPDGNFPSGVPNPMIVENRIETSQAVKKFGADFGVAFDGDFDRCFIFDELGKYVQPYYLSSLIAEYYLKQKPGQKIIHDPRLVWSSIDVAKKFKGEAIVSKAGHSFIKEKMRQENAIYGCEISAHHYFREFNYCDSGMIPWIIIAEILFHFNQSLSTLIRPFQAKYPISEELNYKNVNFESLKNLLIDTFISKSPKIDYVDGISMEFFDWRFNVRSSNTEDLVRINIETKGEVISIKNCIKKLEMLIFSLNN